jgi:hypothetical protein
VNNNSVNEGNSVIFNVTSDIAAPVGGLVISYNFNDSTATNGVDFNVTPATGTIIIPAGEKTGVLTLNALTDNLPEPPETITVTLNTVPNTTINNGKVTTIINDTTVVLESNKFFFSGSTSVTEGGEASYTISHAPITDFAITIPYTISGTATNGSDYSVSDSSPIVFGVGDTTKTIKFPITLDGNAESNETLTITLGEPSSGIIATGQNSISTTIIDASTASTNNVNLQAGTDIITGTANDDVISGYINLSGSNSTFNAGDSIIDANGGNDTLALTVDGLDAGKFPIGVAVSGIEKISIKETGGIAGNYNLSAIAGVTTVINNMSSDDMTFNVATGTKIIVQGNGVVSNGSTTFNNSTDLTFKDGVTGGNITRNGSSTSSITLNSTGIENVVDTIDLDTANSVTSLTINATSNLVAALANDYTNAIITVVGNASTVDLSGSALPSTITNVNAGAFSGGVALQVSQTDKISETAFTGGMGNDTLDIGRVKYNGAVSINGGNGIDILKISDQDALSATTVTNISNFERLEIYDDNDGNIDTFDASILKGITAIQLNADSLGDGYIINNLSASQAMNLILAGNQTVAPTFNVSNASLIGNIDSIAFVIDAGETGNAVTVAGLNAAGIEFVNLNAMDNFNATTLTGLTALATLTITGSGDVNLITDKLQLNLNSTIDASNSKGMIRVDATSAINPGTTTNGISIKGSLTQANFLTGSKQADVLMGGAGADFFNGGEGADTLNGGLNADTLNGEAGNDVINGGAGADIISGGAGIDTLNGDGGDDLFIYEATTDLFDKNALIDRISGGSGTNSLQLGKTGAAFAISDKDIWTGATGIDALVGVVNTTANTLILDKSAETAGIKLIDLSSNSAATGNIINAGSFTSTNMMLVGSVSGITSIVGGAGNDTIIGGAGNDTITTGAGSDVINVTGGVDTITDFAVGVDQLTISAGASAKITVDKTGTGIVNASSITNAGILIIDGSAGVNTNTTPVTVMATESITGSSGVDSITSGGGSDVITGGTGVDILTGGAGADKFVITSIDTDTAAASAAVTDVITDFKTLSDTLSFGLGAGVAYVPASLTVPSTGNYIKASATVANLATLLTAADDALTGLVKYYVGQLTGGATYVVTDSDANGITDVIQLTGVTLATIAPADIVA